MSPNDRLWQECETHNLPSSLAIVSNQAYSLINFRASLIEELSQNGVKVWAFAPDYSNEWRDEVKRLGAVPVDYSLNRTGLNPLRDIVDTLRLAFSFRQLKPEASLGYFIKPVIFGTIAAWLARVPKRFALIEGLGFLFVDDESERFIKRRILKKVAKGLYWLSFRLCCRVALLNRDDHFELSRHGVLPISKTKLIPGIGLNLSKWPFSPRVKHPITFVLVGRMLREKGVYDFVEAAKIIKGEFPQVRFVLVGGIDVNPGSIRKEELEGWNINGVVQWVGITRDVKSYLVQASVFVLPSYREGLPRSTQEAMALGLPVITTDVPGCRDTIFFEGGEWRKQEKRLIKQGRNGFLAPVRDARSLAESMRYFINRPSLIDSMGLAGRRIAEERYDVRKVNQSFLSFLSS